MLLLSLVVVVVVVVGGGGGVVGVVSCVDVVDVDYDGDIFNPKLNRYILILFEHFITKLNVIVATLVLDASNVAIVQ